MPKPICTCRAACRLIGFFKFGENLFLYARDRSRIVTSAVASQEVSSPENDSEHSCQVHRTRQAKHTD